MSTCNRSLRRTMPESLVKTDKTISPPTISRVNGWSLPLHSFQLIAWTAFLYMTIIAFGLFIPLLPYYWRNITYIVIGILFAFHFVVHITAITIDPADPNVRHKKNYGKPMPLLDRNKHKHAIQNQYCHLCEVIVGVKAKHCSACNKCIADFDHHCKWLNNCVGSRNYWYFFSSVASAVLGVIFLIILLLYVFIQYFVEPEELRTDPQFENYPHNIWLAFLPLFPVPTSPIVLLTIAMITLLLVFVSLLLLGHLLLFHLYLLGRQLSTFDYMTQGRQKQTTKLQIKISGPLKSFSQSESLQSAGEKSRTKSEVSCMKSSSRHTNAFFTSFPLRSPNICIGISYSSSQSCLSLKSGVSQHDRESQLSNKKEKNEGAKEKEQNPLICEESLNFKTFSIKERPPGSSTLNSLMLLYSLSSSQQNITTKERLNSVQKKKTNVTTASEVNDILLTSNEKN